MFNWGNMYIITLDLRKRNLYIFNEVYSLAEYMKIKVYYIFIQMFYIIKSSLDY